ncbi:MAG: 3-methyl-2-oxobutanoate hydroxymethyltransferase [Deltaproteobacteria bacterium]|nr:3-methyl-2-oxobutanoate hydroxymethyltransferase [Deltaproteobacteria bacterium]MCB9786756.1 3-methyl-2-oxobutanoate hydroxymethyltransferase [Deltaproteobacteria bacterium]
MGRLTTLQIASMKSEGERIAMVTAYDATFARLIDQSGADMLLVGDSLGMVVQGHATTLPVTMDQMVYHTQAVVRGSERAMVVADLPFMAYQPSVADALRNAGRLMAEGGCQAVKLEGGERSAEAVAALVAAGVPVIGHVGLTPQSVNVFGGYKVQGRGDEAAERVLRDARAVADAGAFGIVLEIVPGELAATITEALEIPTIGIGAGPHCDGQVLVCYDLLGLNEGFSPKFLKHYGTLGEDVRGATRRYVDEVKAGTFPADEHTFH